MINFRPHQRTDISYRVKWLNNKNATAYAIDDPNHEATIAEQEDWFNHYKTFFTICDDQNPIGFMGLSSIDLEKKTGNVFIMIGEDEYRGKGIGNATLDFLLSSASKELGLTALTLEVNKLNEPAIRLYKSHGFRQIENLGKEIAMRLEFVI